MMLNELQKEHRQGQQQQVLIEAQQHQIADQQEKIDELQKRLGRLETLSSTPVNVAEQRGAH
jgi:hypothetical protein